ncbi:uncharacterized protein LOC116143675 [Pistacia vera]|uniref:uncharacterized protein LOC116143675 n=1 Tax=Pistacia vera TaxID=55513 RepID=UPI001263E6A0|nr:uncharacterized protein LOC116143675 [Pistacia vera]
MKTFFTLFTLSFLLFASSAEARKDLGEYWKDVMKDKPMPQSIQNLVHVHSAMSAASNQKANIVGQEEGKPLVKDLNHQPESTDDQKSFVKNFKANPIFYPAYSNAKPTDKESFVKNFKPNPIFYPAYAKAAADKKSFAKNFEASPIFYPVYAKPAADKKSFAKNFEASPIFYPVYAKPAVDKKSFAKNFVASPVFYPAYAAYSKSTNDNSFVKDSELKPTTKNTKEKPFVKDSETQT